MSKRAVEEQGNNKKDIVKSHGSSKPTAYAGPDQIVYEGSEVKLDGSNSFAQNNTNTNNRLSSYYWRQVAGPIVDLDKNNNIVSPSFKAPYVDVDFNTAGSKNPYTNLSFELVVTDDQGVQSIPDTVNIIVKMIQRALVLQGGGSLGAYEAGVFQALCERLTEKDKAEGNIRKNRPLFDIIAGTSIGTVNAAIIVDNVSRLKKENHSMDTEAIWNNASKQLNDFWNNISVSSFDSPLFWSGWDVWHGITRAWIENYRSLSSQNEQLTKLIEDYPNPFYFFWPQNYSPIASGESARRYFSWMRSGLFGTPNVMSGNFMQPDTKFLNMLSPFPRFDNTPLTQTIRNYWDYENHPIKTSFEKGEPRLLLVSVDVMDVTNAAAFDSYLCETIYENGKPSDGEESRHIIKYPEGVNIEHVTASMSPHLKYKYPKFKEVTRNKENNNNNVSDEENDDDQGKTNRYRYFWDGAYLSNTPLRELIHAHRYYWHDVQHLGTQVPHLEVYIVNLYPTVEENLPVDADTIQDRELDIRFHDRTNYDIKVANMISDYLILYGQVKNLALKHLSKYGQEVRDSFNKELEKEVLDKPGTKSEKRSKKEDEGKRTYRDLIEGRFDIAKVVYVDRKDDGSTIFGKAAEFSESTIKDLFKNGYKEALDTVDASYIQS
ncbi:MAG: patatin-like phospholipase family protein [Nitrososphaeraceae archaeon]